MCSAEEEFFPLPPLRMNKQINKYQVEWKPSNFVISEPEYWGFFSLGLQRIIEAIC